MRIEPLNFRNFEGAAAGAMVAARRPVSKKTEEAPPASPPPPSYSEEDLKAAEMKGYQRGFLEGQDEGKKQAQSEHAEINRQLMENTEKLTHSLKPLIDDYTQMTRQVREDVPKVALAIIKKLSGGILESNAEKIVSEMALSCAQTMLGEPKLSISVHPNLAESLKEKLQQLAVKTQTATHFIVLRDEAMSLTDCRLEWKYGAMERHTGALWQEIERVVESMVASAKRETETHMQRLEQDLPKE